MNHAAHAWIVLRALEKIVQLDGSFGSRDRNRHVRQLLDFLQRHIDVFPRAVWYPHSILHEDLEGRHCWPCRIDDKRGHTEHRMPPVQNLCQLKLHRNDWHARIVIDRENCDLPSRCEGISRSIRDFALFRNHLDKGDPMAFNDRQIALGFMLLAHYAADAHVPFRCDARNLVPLTAALEDFWESEIEKSGRDVFQPTANSAGYSESYPGGSPILREADRLVREKAWGDLETRSSRWNDLLGTTNNNIDDYIVSVCRVSFFISRLLAPDENVDPRDEQLWTRIRELTPVILADAVNSVALLWIVSWERWAVHELRIDRAARREQRHHRV